ncbi:MAG: hypothetical protein KKC01_08790 [Gammaproteobacteria bacterium]|nr:hypothetical protein [Gammaproteobacteria bacterium]
MTDTPYWDEKVPTSLLGPADTPPNEKQVELLWQMFVGITEHWQLDFAIDLLRSRWLDMLQARRSGDPDYTEEYINAAKVFEALLDALGSSGAIETIYGKTIVTKESEATTRLRHAKYFVANDFIRCFTACGGFRALVPGRNYTGFLGGSRFREWAPVRTRARQ